MTYNDTSTLRHIHIKKGEKMDEAMLVKKIKLYLKTIPNIFYWKEHGGLYGTAGIPDIIVCYKGKFIAFEAKVGNNKATTLQQITINDIQKAGGFAAVVRSVEEVKHIMEIFMKE